MVWLCIHINHKRMVWFNVLNWNQYRSVWKSKKIRTRHLWNGSDSNDSTLKPLPGPKGTDIYMKITMLSPFPSTSKSPLWPLCSVSVCRPCSVWMTSWPEFYHPLTDLPGKCTLVMGLFLHLWLGRGVQFRAKTEEEKRDMQTGYGYMTYSMCTTHTHTQIYSLFTQSITTTSFSSSPAELLRYCCQLRVERSLH